MASAASRNGEAKVPAETVNDDGSTEILSAMNCSSLIMNLDAVVALPGEPAERAKP
jgi:hypothetical protein